MPVQTTNAASLRSLGRRKSNFPAINNIPADTTLDFVSDGVNFKITKADFLTALNVIGAIVQDGAVAGTPVLDIQGTVHNIRNLEDGPGVKATVSPENGIKIEHNFDFDSAGVPLSPDATLIQPVLRSIVAGAGIAVTGVGDTIVVAESGAPVSVKTVIISELADFPTPVAGVITLAANTQYLLVNDVNVSANRFVLSDNVSVNGISVLVTKLTYTGTVDMFTAVNVGFSIGNLTVEALTGRVFNVQNAAKTKMFSARQLEISGCKEVALIEGFDIVDLNNVTASFSVNGISFNGSSNIFTSNLFFFTATAAGSVFDLTGATLRSFTNRNGVYNLAAGTFLLKGDTASANIDNLGAVFNNAIIGAGSGLSGIKVEDAKWFFVINDGIVDTTTDALLSMQSNAVATVISIIDTPVKVAGTWVVEFGAQMTGDTAGNITLDTVKAVKLPLTASLSVEPVSGGAQNISAFFAINGTVIANSKRSANASSGSPASITMPWQEVVNPADIIDLHVENNSGTTNILVSSACFRVN